MINDIIGTSLLIDGISYSVENTTELAKDDLVLDNVSWNYAWVADITDGKVAVRDENSIVEVGIPISQLCKLTPKIK